MNTYTFDFAEIDTQRSSIANFPAGLLSMGQALPIWIHYG
jgi:hypothetical protein